MKNFSELESYCSLTFDKSGPYWHLWTPENHPIIFPDTQSFKAGMNIIAICARLVPEVKIITFELMSNHLHITAAGAREAVLKLFELFRRYLRNYLKTRDFSVDLRNFTQRLRLLETIIDLRNVICYNNRNGFIITPDDTPFSYRWGANSYYFNPDAKARHEESRSFLTRRERRLLIRTHDSDTIDRIKTVDGYACPLDYCAVKFGESMFRSASHYFRDISKNIEANKSLAAEIGESIFYSDDELFSLVCRICKEKYDQHKPSLIPASAKRELAIQLHHEYNCSNKQIYRILKLDLSVLAQMFPEKH